MAARNNSEDLSVVQRGPWLLLEAYKVKEFACLMRSSTHVKNTDLPRKARQCVDIITHLDILFSGPSSEMSATIELSSTPCNKESNSHPQPIDIFSSALLFHVWGCGYCFQVHKGNREPWGELCLDTLLVTTIAFPRLTQ